MHKEIETLKRGGKGTPLSNTKPPDWVKLNAAPAQTEAVKERKKRAKHFTRPRQTPTEEGVHACSHCPDCGSGLVGGSDYSRRQMIELPSLPVRIIDYILQARYCGVCQKRCVPTPDLSEIAVGQSRFGQQVHALVACLRQSGRLPVRTIAAVPSALCHLKISTGEVSEMLFRVARQGKTTYASLQKALRAAPFVHADETGWREKEPSGYVWRFSTPSVRSFTRHKSRAAAVPASGWGRDYRGIIVSDFYSAYSFPFGLPQRGWVPLLRDWDDFAQKPPTDAGTKRVQRVRNFYWEARTFLRGDRQARALARVDFQEGLPPPSQRQVTPCLPQRAAAKRRVNFASALFTFCGVPGRAFGDQPGGAERSTGNDCP